MDKLRRKRTSKVKNKKEADPSNAKLSTTHKFIISIALGIFLALCEIAYKEAKKHECEDRWDRSLGPEALGGGIVRGLLKAGCGAESSYEHHYIHHRRGW